MPMPRNGKSILMTPDPYHTPGYGGFCPQFKYKIGETFGMTTSKLLTNDAVASSGKLVLADIHAHTNPLTKSDPRAELLKTRTQSWGDQKLMQQMISGYTGFIPRSEHHFGNRYVINCKGAISDFEADHQQYKRNAEEMRLTEAVQSGKIDKSSAPSQLSIKSRYITPMKPIAQEHKPYISPSFVRSAESPFFMTNDNSKKRFMSGYTGFVPRARSRLGMGYPIITHEALNEFSDDTKRLNAIQHQPIIVHREDKAVVDSKYIYPVESGLVPHYTGHIPGQKFRYGETFGHSTENVKHSEVAVSV